MFHRQDREKKNLEPGASVPAREDREERCGFYETGNTTPPKEYLGLLIVIMVACIFFGGLGGAAAMLRLHPAAKAQEPTQDDGILRLTSSEPTEPAVEQTAPAPTEAAGDVELHISQTPASVENLPQEGGLSLQEIYTKVSPSVVSITAQTASGTSCATGIILSEDGYLVTNEHVIAGVTSVEATLNSGAVYPAAVVGQDEVSDLAVLHIQAEGLTPAELGDSTKLRVGDAVCAIGDPLGQKLRGTMTDGIVSAINRDLSVGGRQMTLIQTNAALNAGNSGGPLINCYGQVVGINTMKIGSAYSAAGVEGLGFAIPMDAAKEILEDMIRMGYVPGRPALGLEVEELPALTMAYHRLPSGLYIRSVTAGTQCAEAGVAPGDLLLSLGGTKVSTMAELSAALGAYSAGDQVELVLYRRGQQYALTITLLDAGTLES